MEKEKFDVFKQYVKTAFERVTYELLNSNCNLCNDINQDDNHSVVIVIGITGKNKGRIILEADLKTSEMIAEIMNFGPLKDNMDLYMNMGEYANMFSGRATTYINDHFKENEMRLTPPAIFSGENLDINTPNIRSECVFYMGEFGQVKIDIGFEGD